MILATIAVFIVQVGAIMSKSRDGMSKPEEPWVIHWLTETCGALVATRSSWLMGESNIGTYGVEFREIER